MADEKQTLIKKTLAKTQQEEKPTTAWGELLNRYSRVFKAAWKVRKQMDPPKRLPDEIHFLPAALALQDKPVHPAPRYIVLGIIAFFILALIWSIVGKVDIVATCTGKIIPSGKSKIIQPSEVAVVKKIFVADGQTVHAGDILVELDTSATYADVERLKNELLTAEVDKARASALLEAIQENKAPQLSDRIPTISKEEHRNVERWLNGQYLELQSSLEQADAEIAKRKAELQSTQTSIASLRKTLPITKKLVADYKDLAAQEYIPRHAYLEKQQVLLDQERQLAVQISQLNELNSAIQAAEKQKQTVIAQTRRTMLDLEQQSNLKAISINEELKKAQQRNSLMTLTSPVDGTVQQLAVHTVGGVVTAAQPLMVIVPKDQPVEVEAMLENKDIGFVSIGQEVEVKVDTFIFTKYGVIHGKVVSISNDAIEDEKRGLLYSIRIALEKNKVQVGGKLVPLSPGMSIRAEIKTSQRRIIEYFLSPLQQHINESLDER